MAFTDQQARLLKAKLDSQHVKTRKANGATLHYIEGWHAIAEANRIFGYDGWDRRTLVTNCVWTGTSNKLYFAAYTAKVRIYVRAGEALIVREGSGSGEGKGDTPAKRTRLASKPLKPMPPSVPLPLSAMCSGLPFTTANERGCANITSRRHRNRWPRDRG
jgi:hypothetical protein